MLGFPLELDILMSIAELVSELNPWWRDADARRARGYPVRRHLYPELIARLQREGRRATLLLGPRQVGKTVLLLQLVDGLLEAGWPPANIAYFDFADERIKGEVSAREVVETRPVDLDETCGRIFLLDEIRSASNWDRWLKQAVDQRVGRILATDSAAGLLKDGARESGQGRWDEVVMEGLSFREFLAIHEGHEGTPERSMKRLTLLQERYLARGGFPEHAPGEDSQEVHRQLRRDIADRAIERDLARAAVDVQRVKDLFVYLVQDSGGELNAEARARDLQADSRSVRDWIRLLEDTLLIRALERRTTRASATLKARQKFRYYAADPGLVAAFSLAPPESSEVKAHLFEAAVYRHLREIAELAGARLTYFRPEEDLEIDFVLEGPAGLVGVEVKSGRRVRREDVDRLRRAASRLGADRTFILHDLPDEPAWEGLEAVPLRSFLLDPEIVLRSSK
jgi:predicted AAA+ superfamily ATPase